MSKTNKQKNKGFAAFILVVSISGLTLALSMMQYVEFGHFFDQARLKEYRYKSYYAAYSCIDQVILAFSHDFFFDLDEPREIPDLFCSIDSIQTNGNEKTIHVHGNYKNIIINRLANIRLFDDHLEIIKIE